MEPQQQVDMWFALMTQRERELIAEGKTKEQAEKQACAEIRRQIRNS